MGIATAIEWTDATWNPIRGCSRVSEGCRNCYAEKVAYRFSDVGQPYHGLVGIGGKWNGNTHFAENHLLDPLKWKKPRRIFVNSMSDLFHENVTDEMLDQIFAVMALCPQHTFQVLTKRPERMRHWYTNHFNVRSPGAREMIFGISHQHPEFVEGREWIARAANAFDVWPLPNVWLGVSVENQKAAGERISLLRQTPAAVRFLSMEPLLGTVNLRHEGADALPVQVAGSGSRSIMGIPEPPLDSEQLRRHSGNVKPFVDWVIVGGESGPGARPMHPDWVRSLRDQCAVAGVPFFFKQWGEWRPAVSVGEATQHPTLVYGPENKGVHHSGTFHMDHQVESCLDGGEYYRAQCAVVRVGKKAAGHLLDGQEHHAFPVVSA